MITGWNLLNQVRSVIPSMTLKYRKVGTLTRNAMGYLVDNRGEDITVAGCYVQPMPKAMYAQLGLQPNQNARRVFLPADAKGMESYPVDGDLLLFEGREWKIIAADNWYEYDGWKALDVVENKAYAPLQISSGAVVSSGGTVTP